MSDDGDTASQRSIALSSPRNSVISVDPYGGIDNDHSLSPEPTPTYPPKPPSIDRRSILSTASSLGKKARPESLLVAAPSTPLILGIALVDFNHLVGPKIEYSKGEIFQDEEIQKILPFLALPDGAHLSANDYTYFHLVPSRGSSTLFGISCNQQMPASQLLVRPKDVTRSTVQKAVVILATKPIFGPIRDKLGVVTSALFQQRDFSSLQVLDDFESGLEASVRGQMTESGLHMGTSLRQLVHTFRQRTLLLLKALILQKRIMFSGHPVERLCTYQYSLVSLIPGLLHALEDSASPTLSTRATQLFIAGRPTSLKTSERKSMLRYLGMPLEVFGTDSFFQPYLPLQQLDMLKESRSYICGTTNSIVTQQKEIDLLVNTETGVFEFRDPALERLVSLTSADRKWMDEIVRDVNEAYNPDAPADDVQIAFKGSDDYLRAKFEEYIFAALASVKYRDFIARGEGGGVLMGNMGENANSTDDFNPLFIAEFKQTIAYEVWERVTDPLLFDIVEPRHPCMDKPSVVADIGLRLQEGLQELKIEQQLAPAREAVSRTLTVGSANFFKAVEGVRERWQQSRSSSSSSSSQVEDSNKSRSSTPVEISKADLEGHPAANAEPLKSPPAKPLLLARQATIDSNAPTATAAAAATLNAWGAGIGSFISSRAGRFSLPKVPALASPPVSSSSSSSLFFGGNETTPTKTTSLPPLPREAVNGVGNGHSGNGNGIGGAGGYLNKPLVPVPPLKGFGLHSPLLSPENSERDGLISGSKVDAVSPVVSPLDGGSSLPSAPPVEEVRVETQVEIQTELEVGLAR